MRLLLTLLGAAMLVLGLVWAAQGAGLLRVPAESFMLDQRPWVWRGLTLALVGVGLLALGRGARR